MALAAFESGFERLCAQALAAAEVPGAVVGVRHGSDEWVRAFGVCWACVPSHSWACATRPSAPGRGGDAVTPATTFRIASITKPFTALLALRLVRDGALELEETVRAPAPRVTVRHLLAHLGGFESECGDLGRFGEGDDALAALARELLRQRRVVQPGELWSYCNAGYWLLGHVLAERSGTTYERVLEERVLRPLGLRATHFEAPDAAGHDPEPQRLHYPRARRASGGLTSDVADLLAFAQHLASPGAAPLRVRVVATPGGSYGLGLMLEEAGGLELWGHTGSWGGYESLLAVEPQRDFAFVALANAASARPVLRELRDAAVEHVLGVRREPAAAVTLAADEVALLVGRYASPEVDVTFTGDAAGLAVEATQIASDGARTRLPPAHARPLGDRLFEIVDGGQRGSRFDFHPGVGRPRFVRFSSRLAERAYDAT